MTKSPMGMHDTIFCCRKLPDGLVMVGNVLREYEAKFTDGLLVGLRAEDVLLYDERGLRQTQEK